MSDRLLLNNLCQPRDHNILKASSNGKKNKVFFEEDCTSDDLVKQLMTLGEIQKDLSIWVLIDSWQSFLSLLLILHERGQLQQYAPKLIEHMRCLNTCFIWQELQLVSVYKTLCYCLLGQPIKDLPIHQNKSGAVSLEWGGYWSWGGVPHNRIHAELGLLWCLLGQLTEDKRYLKAAESLANWQLNTLDHNFLPFIGLFSQEEDASETRLLINNFLLFSAIATFANRSDMAAVAEKQYARLATLSPSIATEFSSLQLAYDRWLSKYPKISPALPHLPDVFKDDQLVLAICRSNLGSAVSTLAGGGTSMGAMYRGDVKIVSFGPQHLPLGDCGSFGVESQLDGLAEAQMKISEVDKMYCIQGLTRLTPYQKKSPLQATFRNGEHSGFWIDTKQSYQDEQLSIETVFRGLFDIGSLAFAFFVKAQSCAVETIKVVNLRSFDRYQGEVKTIILQGNKTSLTIEAGQKLGEMQVIPLGGGNNFWGADFLVAYLLDSQESKYSWLIK